MDIMNRNRKLRFYLFLVMVVSASVVGVISLTSSYHQALKEQKTRLAEIAQSRVRMIEAVAKFDSQYSVDYPGGSWEATLSQIREAHQNFKGFGVTGEFVLVKLVEDQIVFLLRLRHSTLSPKNSTPSHTPLVSKFAEPMKKALQGHSGVMTGIDYRGVEVLAAFEPVALTDMGIVVKMDIAEIRAPFIRAGVISAFGGFIVIMVGGTIFLRISESFTSELEYTNKKLKEEYDKGQRQSQALELSKQKYQTLFDQVKAIIEEVCSESGEELYNALVKNLATSLGFKYCFVGELDPSDDEKINTLALWSDSDFSENVTYTLAQSPCENVVGKKLCSYSGKVWEIFPDDKMLADLSIETYVGIPLNDSSNNPLGILCIMHDERVTDLTNVKLILPLFAVVAQSEMERQMYEKELHWESEKIQVSRDVAMAANDFSNVEDTLKFVLQRFCQFIGFPVGHFYFKTDTSSIMLVPSRLWYFDDPDKYKTLKAVTESTTFEAGEGLPSEVMSTQRPKWIHDVYAEDNFPRARKSDQLGVRSGLACPIMIRKGVVGVMEFFTPDILPVDWDIVDTLEQLSTQVGRILERARSENLLREQAQVLNQVHDAVILLDKQSIITGWNKGAERVFGYEEKEILGKPFDCIFYEDDKFLQQVLIQPALISDRFEREMKAVTKSGDLIYINVSLSALCDEHCFPQSIVCYALDITEKKYARDQLENYSQDLEHRVTQRTAELNASIEQIKESRDQIEGILKSIGEGILVTDYYGKIMLLNPAAENILGISKEDVLGQYAEQVFDNDSLLDCWNLKINEKYPCQSFGFELGENEKNKKYIQGTSSVLNGEHNDVVGIVVVLRDTTRERELDFLKTQFISTAAHELRTPLTSLQGFSEVLLNRQNLGKDTERKYLHYINEESIKLARIINDFLDISRIESGKGILLNKSVCSVRDTIDSSLHIFDEQINDKHKFEFNYPAQTLNWYVDLDKMEQVLKNVYSNAVKYSPNGGTIRTTARVTGKLIEISIEDEGLGMNTEQLDRIHERFFRGDNFAPNIPGSGLGMTIVKYILEAHGGKVNVESELNIGTRVLLSIPVVN